MLKKKKRNKQSLISCITPIRHAWEEGRKASGCRMRRGRQSAFWLHLLRCFPTAEQLSPATADQPSALKGQAPQLGSPSKPVARFRGESAWPSRRCLSYQTSPGCHTCVLVLGRPKCSLFFFFSTESRAENDIIVSPQYHLLFLDIQKEMNACSGMLAWRCELKMNLFEATEFFQSLWIACFWRCDGRWKAASNG